MQDVVKSTLMMRYTSPLMVLAAAGLMIVCTGLREPGAPAAHVAAVLAQSTFGIYLLHDHPMIREHVMAGRFAWIAQQGPAGIVLLTSLGAACVFACCAVVDKGREALFHILRVKNIVGHMLARAESLICRQSK